MGKVICMMDERRKRLGVGMPKEQMEKALAKIVRNIKNILPPEPTGVSKRVGDMQGKTIKSQVALLALLKDIKKDSGSGKY